MRRRDTIGFRLTAAFLLLFAILFAFGLFGLLQLGAFNRESSAIRERWLKSTRYLGDINNFTSDFRALEASFLLAPASSDAEILLRDAVSLDAAIARAERGYEELVHDREELRLYSDFEKVWRAYRTEAQRVLATRPGERNDEALSVYLNASRSVFAQATDFLDRLSALTNENAQAASHRAARAIQSAWNSLCAAVILGLLLVVLILLYVSRIVIFPLRDLAQCMRSLSSGDLDVELPDAQKLNEIGEMTRAVAIFRNNAVDLKLSQRGLARQATMLEEKLAQEIRLNQQQRNFISMASHEFRTPMTIIDGHAQRLLNAQKPELPNAAKERAKKIRWAVKRMSVMIDTILHSSRFFEDAPELYLHYTEFDMRAMLHEVCKLNRGISPNAVIVEMLGSESLKIPGDRDLLFQVFVNIVANSVKYSPPGLPIEVSCRSEGDRVIVEIEDRGIGIPKADLPHVFERYFRAVNVASVAGAGIGLYFVKLVVELHGGAVKVESLERKGAKFTVDLPKARSGETTGSSPSPHPLEAHGVSASASSTPCTPTQPCERKR
jgi:signal transduction histidine kinase